MPPKENLPAAQRYHYKSDFTVVVKDPEAMPWISKGWDFFMEITNERPSLMSPRVKTSRQNGVYSGCYLLNGLLHIACDNHGLRPGRLWASLRVRVPDTTYADSHRDLTAAWPLPIELTLDGPAEGTVLVDVPAMEAIVSAALADTLSVRPAAEAEATEPWRDLNTKVAVELEKANVADAQLAETTQELAETTQELAEAQSDLAAEVEAHAATQNELSSTKATLSTTEETLAATEETLAATEESLSEAQENVAALTATNAVLQEDSDWLAFVAESLEMLGLDRVDFDITDREEFRKQMAYSKAYKDWWYNESSPDWYVEKWEVYKGNWVWAYTDDPQWTDLKFIPWIDLSRLPLRTEKQGKVVKYLKSVTTLPNLDWSYLTNMVYWCSGNTDSQLCCGIKSFVMYNLVNVTTLLQSFFYNYVMEEIRLYDLLKCTTIEEGFAYCPALKTAVLSGLRLLTSAYKAFKDDTALEYVGDIAFKDAYATNYNQMFYNCTALERVESVTFGYTYSSLSYYLFYGCTALKYCLIKNLGQSSSDTAIYVRMVAKNWGAGSDENLQSLVDSFVNNTYDRVAAGFTTACVVYLHADQLARLTDAQKAQATAKGYTFTSVTTNY